MATVSPLFVSNLCCCGHDLAVHTLAAFPNVGLCAICYTSNSFNVGDNHDFTPASELYPRAEFPQSLPIGCVSPGGFGPPTVASLLSTAGNPKGSSNVIFSGNLITSGVRAGMTFTTLPNTPGNAISYRILVVLSPTTLTIPQPGLLFNLGTVRCLFQGADGSTQGGGLAPNGQRAG